MTTRLHVGDVAEASLTITDPDDGSLIDPTGLTFCYRSPGQTIAESTTLTYGTDAALVRDSTGQYRVTLTVDTPGLWLGQWQSTGTGAGSEPVEWHVVPEHC